MIKIKNIIKSQNDKLNYNGYILRNKLKVIFVQDADSKESAIVFRVGRGSLSDPKSHNGIAHFLEHMLFMGSNKYPLPDTYREFITSNGGSTNAWTELTNTVYYHTINKEHFLESFDMISRFFLEPLINKTYVDKEINIVHSEFEKNKQNDLWRENHLIKHISDKDSFYNSFSTGSLDTLRKDDVYDKLMDFYKNEYSANLMNVVVYHHEDVEQQVCDFLEQIENKNLSERPFEHFKKPFNENNLGRFLKYKSIKKENILKVNFFIKSDLKHYKNSPGNLVSFLIGHESEGSIHSLLVKEGLIYSLSSGNNNYEEYFANFSISLTLTEKGNKSIKRIIQIIFAYINMLKREKIEEWVFKEIKQEREFQFRFQNKVKGLSRAHSILNNMSYYPLELCNKVGYLMEEFTPELHEEFLNQLQPENSIIILSSDLFDQLDQIEPIYSTCYSFEKIREELLEIMRNPNLEEASNSKLHFPPRNYFLPENFDIVKSEKSQEFPEKLLNQNDKIDGDLFHKLDSKFSNPTVLLTYNLLTPSTQENIQTYLLRDLWNKILTVYLKEFVYLAQMGLTELSINNTYTGIEISVSGYSDKMDIFMKTLADKILEFMHNTPNDYLEEQFEIMKKKKVLELNKLLLSPPYNLVLMSRVFTFKTNSFSFEFLNQELLTLSFQDFLKFKSDFLNCFSFDSLHMGNLSKSESAKLNSNFISQFTSNERKTKEFKKLKNSQQIETRVVKIRKHTTFILTRKLFSKNEKNDCVLISYQYKQGYEYRHTLNLLAKYIESFCFDDLRTEKELGYIVFSMPYSINGVYFFQFLIQSDSVTSMECAGHIYKFVEKHRSLIRDLEEDKFENYKKGLINTLEQEFNNIYEEKSVHWNQITSRRYEFDSKVRSIEGIKNVKLQDILELYEEIFFSERRIFETHYICEKNFEKNKELLKIRKLFQNENFVEVDNEEEFKNQMELFVDTTLKI